MNKLPDYPTGHTPWGDFLLDPRQDGIEHCNIYSRARTGLGRSLTNFANAGFTHPEYGAFESVEGFHFYIATGFKHHELRSLYGLAAKKAGIQYERVHVDNFDALIQEAVILKLEQNPKIRASLLKCPLPFAHYYVYGVRHPYRVADKCKQSGALFGGILEIQKRYAKGS